LARKFLTLAWSEENENVQHFSFENKIFFIEMKRLTILLSWNK
jgi:hypothetical protein